MKQQMNYLHFYEKYNSNRFIQLLLYLCSLIFLIVYKSRLALYKLNILKSYSLPAFVISIGNITSGGTGKTPFTIEVAKHFISKGFKVGILSRGYGRQSKNSTEILLVSDGNDILSDVEYSGDEPYLIAKKVPKAIVAVGKDRYKTGKTALTLGAEVLILDDGFQHLRLKRNINILMLDSYKPFDNYHLLPAGKLRELPESLKRANAIVVSNSDRKELDDNVLSIILKTKKNIPLIKTSYKITELKSLNTKRNISLNDAKKIRFYAFCGIANPESFIDLLKRNDLQIANYKAFPDHHTYTYDDIKIIIDFSVKNNIEDVIITEKDEAKIIELCQAAPLTFWSAKLEMIFKNYNAFEDLFSNNKP